MLSEKEIQKNRKLFTETDRDLSAVFKILSDINRYRIFLLLTGSSRLSIGNIARILDISVPLASQHLRILAHGKFLEKKREGKKIYPKLERHNPLVKVVIKALQQARTTK